jgi:hypothetical protein
MCFDFHHRVACVILRVAFVTGAVLGNLLNDMFGILAAAECAFRESPIMFGLAQIGAGRGLPFCAVVVVVVR